MATLREAKFTTDRRMLYSVLRVCEIIILGNYA